MALLDQAKPMRDRPLTVNICLYGEPGIGKTVLACKGPGVLEVQCEKNAALPLMLHEETKNVPVIDILDNSRKIMDLYWELKKGERPEIKTVVIDTISELQSKNLSEIWKAEEAKGKRPEGVPYQPDYRVNTEYLREVILNYCDLDRNVIFVAHETEEKNEQTGVSLTRPMFTPRLASAMFATCDVMAYMTMDVNAIKGTQTRMLRVTPTKGIKAKDRLGLPSQFPADEFWGLLKLA